jgi:hypothetical protein
MHLAASGDALADSPVSDLPAATYDEQLVEVLTQSFTGLAYNVTATVQTDSDGYGPAYLLNGLSSLGYWYQVGISYDWPYQSGGYVPGFAMNYETFNPSGNSIFPTNGAGGLTSLSGTVNPNDEVLLRLSFSSGNVVMYVHDWNTGASATESYSAEGVSSFVGGASNGFFTGPMTEWWHASASFSNEAQVIYSESTTALSSAYILADEWVPPNGPVNFDTTSPLLQFTDPTQLQSFSTNGLTAYADAYEFVTGALASLQTTITLLPAGQSSPISSSNTFTLTYSSNGVLTTAQDSGGTVTLNVDSGTNVVISSASTGSSSSEKWVLDSQATSATVPAAGALTLYYYDLLEQTTSYSLFGGAAPSAPVFSYLTAPPTPSSTNTLSPQSITLSQSPSSYMWLVRGSLASATQAIAAAPTERWSTQTSSWTISSPLQVPSSIPYYHQYALGLDYLISGGGSPEPVSLTGTSWGTASTAQYGSGTSVWLDAGSPYSLSNPLQSSSTDERWFTPAGTSGVLGGPSTFSATYYNQYQVSAAFSIVGGGSPSAPSLSYTALGSASSIQLSTSSQSFWADAGSTYSAPAQLSSSQTERWSAATGTGTVDGPDALTITYNHQFLLTITGAGLTSQWYNAGSSATLSVPGVFGRASGSGLRVTSYSIDGASPTAVQPTAGTVVVSVLMDAAHTVSMGSVNQYQVSLDAAAAKALSSITTPTISGDSGWYDQGTPVSLVLSGVWNRSSGTGERLESYTVNGKTVNVVTAGQTVALSLASISSPQAVSASITLQYQLSTPSGSVYSITAPQISGDIGWYDSGTSVLVVYNYTWNPTSEQSRTDAVGYAVDQSAPVSLKRAGNGTFQVQVVMTVPHSIGVQSVTQYHLGISGGSGVTLSAASPTGDSYYDAGSSLTASTDYTWGLTNGNARQNLVSFALDGSVTNVTRAQSGSFTTPPLAFGSSHQLTFNSVTQYLVSLAFQDGSGTATVQPASVQIQVNDRALVDVNSSQVWLDGGTSFQIHRAVWENADVTPTSPAVYTVSGPALESIPLRVYAGEVTATDYLNFPISGASLSVTLVNGTTLQRTTAPNGVAQLGLIPVGTFQGKLSYLGTTTTITGDASTQASTSVKVLVSYSFLAIMGVVAAVAVVGAALLVRRGRKSNLTEQPDTTGSQ